MLFEAGALEVHVRISSPPIVSPCFYGIDMATEDELIAVHAARSRRCASQIGATSLAYLSLDGSAGLDAAARGHVLPRLPDPQVSDARSRRTCDSPSSGSSRP